LEWAVVCLARVLIYLGHELVVIDVARADNDHVISNEVVSVEGSNVVDGQVVGVVPVSLNWLAHHMFSVHVEVHVFNEGLLESLVTC
jgi:hypothetical protein